MRAIQMLVVLAGLGCAAETPELVATTHELRCEWFSLTPRVDQCYMGPVTCFKVVEYDGVWRECDTVAVWCQMTQRTQEGD